MTDDDIGRYEVRDDLTSRWIKVVWCVWGNGNEFPVARIDTNGAADDFHPEYAQICCAALNGAAASKRFLHASLKDQQHGD
ncbi:MAG: hypothetical protein NW206_19745 [Hyphomonadaceae bacterium]|nr:hypothetical protein [Hyphomonadaceae bacterium]